MPDFICYRRGRFKFVECKLGHEQLSKRQKICIKKLRQYGYAIEVHKIVDPCTKVWKAIVDIDTGKRNVIDVQLRMTKKLAGSNKKAKKKIPCKKKQKHKEDYSPQAHL